MPAKIVGERKRVIASRGYPYLYSPQHPKAGRSGYVPEHVLVVEKVLGKYLPDGCEVHHVNEIRTDVRHCNLVVCQDRAYHMLLHQRQDAFVACGNANFRKCFHCGSYSDPKLMRKSGKGFTHGDCHRQYMREYCNRKTEEWRKSKWLAT